MLLHAVDNAAESLRSVLELLLLFRSKAGHVLLVQRYQLLVQRLFVEGWVLHQLELLGVRLLLSMILLCACRKAHGEARVAIGHHVLVECLRVSSAVSTILHVVYLIY